MKVKRVGKCASKKRMRNKKKSRKTLERTVVLWKKISEKPRWINLNIAKHVSLQSQKFEYKRNIIKDLYWMKSTSRSKNHINSHKIKVNNARRI